jgi:hypothetical protein
MSYETKYLKYKMKYLALKNQIGAADTSWATNPLYQTAQGAICAQFDNTKNDDCVLKGIKALKDKYPTDKCQWIGPECIATPMGASIATIPAPVLEAAKKMRR